MALRLFNTLSRSVETFVPMDPAGKQVGLYCCGPTVYDYGHIGNFRTFVFSDLTRRLLEFLGYTVRHVMNITDVEDKIIRRVRESGSDLKTYTRRYETAFMEDLKALGCRTPHVMPRATDYIPEMVRLIERLIERGMAYQAADGSVYFSIDHYRSAGCQYGQLVTLNFEEMRQGERVQSDEYDKESVADFALWKARTEADGEIFWTSPWGEGRPGWHIECSAMSMKQLGPSFDLHLGGEDLVFPHHEDEIAQSEGSGLQSSGCRFVKYWLHAAHLMVEGKKMSKSLGNFFTLRDLLEKGFKGREIRYLLLKAHYRDTLNFTMEGLEEARAALGRLDECLGKLIERAGTRTGLPEDALIRGFSEAMEEDLNISKAWACLFDWIKEVNRALARDALTPDQAAGHLATWREMDAVLGLGESEARDGPPAEVVAMAKERQEARKARDFPRSDALRQALLEKGWAVEDTPSGPKLKPSA